VLLSFGVPFVVVDEIILQSLDYVPPLSGGHADLEILPDLGSLRHPELVAVFT
jgi:hypothetical protein